MTDAAEPGTAAGPRPAGPAAPWDRQGRPPLTGGWWARGLWLAERLAAAGEPPELPDGPPAEGGPGWRAARRLARWRASFPELTEDTAAAQARVFGADPALLHRLLAESPDSLAARAVKPAWADFTERVVRRAAPPAAGGPGCGAPEDGGGPGGADWFQGFAAVVEPFLAEARRTLRGSPAFAGAADRGLIDADAVAGSLTRALRGQLVQLLARVLVLELNVDRLSERLTGGTPQERFRSFVARQSEPAQLAALLDEYAVSARLIAHATANAAQAYVEFVEDFVRDRALVVERILDGADPGTLIDVRTGEGDGHEAGRSVGLLRFSSGAQVVHKPRPLAIHAHFNELVCWLDEALPGLDLRTVRVLDRGGYGWLEYVEAAPCPDEAAAERFYRRQGALLALLYALAATDFHFENLIAVGDQPVAVDLESLFHVDVPRLTGSPLVDGDPAQELLDRSVQRVGLLPAVLVGEDGTVLDVGGMGADKGAAMPFTSPAWEGRGTDEMRLARVRQTFTGGRNRPSLDGRDVDPAHHLDSLRAGFRDGYRAIAGGRKAFLAPGGLLDRFAADTGRVIVRATQTYAQLLTESTHPDVARDALDRDRVIGLLFAQSAGNPRHAALLREEAEDLWAGDVPLFRTRVGSPDLSTHRGSVLPGALPESGLARARRIVSGMGEPDLATQEWIIQAAFAARAADPRPAAAAPVRAAARRAAGAAPAAEAAPAAGAAPAADAADDEDGRHAERALRLARSIADRLAARARRGSSRVGWLGLDVAEDQWRVTALGDDLYGGLAGLALFFAQLAAATGEDRYAGLARQALAPFPAHLETVLRGPARRAWGAFSGLTGTAYALDAAAALLGDRALAAPVPDLLAAAAAKTAEDGQYDLIGGAAGCLAVAEALLDRHGAHAAPLAAACAALLVERAEAQPDGPADAVAWPSPMSDGRPLLGMSHGAGGIGWALLRHGTRTGDAAALRAGRGALGYENAGFDAAIGNWPDFRRQQPRPWQPARPPGTVVHLHAWCHGAPGIGLLRADLPPASRTAADEQALRRAVRSTAAAGRSGNDSLCHGDLGNLELFAAAAASGLAEAAEEYRRAREAVLSGIEARGPVCGTPGGIGNPGLLTGLAGIGHGLLRIAAPGLVAPVLLLAPQGAPR